MAQWSTSESGILRKNKKKDNFEDLLVFGYACKIFRDDEKALHIDQGKHLIPWMGDGNLKIDRYDCRGHLPEINRYEASREGYDAMRWLGLDENERRLEQLCDEERYYSLRINEEEEEMYKEEEQKRNQTNEFQYSYDVPMKPATEETIPTVPENDEYEKYVPSPDLDVPVGIAIPKTVKENARIEKTAMFVSTQGPQMEILIKAKQGDNPQFSFLIQNDPLYKFYRHVLNAIKTGRYRISSAKTDQSACNTSGSEHGDHYLHPSLVSSAASSTDVLLPTIPSVPYRPSANCTYSQLVNRIQGASNMSSNAPPPLPGQTVQPAGDQLDNSGTAPCTAQPNMGNLTYEQQQQYYQYYMQQQYYEYYKHLVQSTGVGDEVSAHPEIPLDGTVQAYIQQMMYAQYFQQTQAQQQQQQSTNPYAQIVSNVNKELPNPYPPPEKPDISKEPVIYETNQEGVSPLPEQVQPLEQNKPALTDGGHNIPNNTAVKKDSQKKQSLLSLMEVYGSDSEGGSSEDEGDVKNDFKMPDDETKIVIDKMASYVVKNGADFENIVKSRADPRFEFLNEDNVYHSYYRNQISEEYKKKRELENEKKEDLEAKEVNKSGVTKAKEKKVIAPVSFSIKKPKEDLPKEIKSALPVDEETDEEDENGEQEQSAQPVMSQPPTLVSSNSARIIYRTDVTTESSKEKENEIKQTSEEPTNCSNGVEIKHEIVEPKEKNEEVVESEAHQNEDNRVMKVNVEDNVNDLSKVTDRFKENGVLDKDDPILEMIDLTDDVLEEKNASSQKDEDIFDLKSDKEKTPKENRALQLERRRKAMAFLKLKSVTPSNISVPDGANTTIPTIDLSQIKSPRRKRISSDSLEEEDKSPKKRAISKTKERESSGEPKSKRSRESEKTVSRKEREKNRKCRSPREEKKCEIHDVSELEEGEMIDDDKYDTKYRKHTSTHKKKKSHKRKHSKSKHSTRSKKKSKKKDRGTPSSSSDSEGSSHS